ncbi:hypothetical protein L218DRAFT_952798 [Marasmius fiardii PR-910]|nr:hypothetical protein L218DRAFT_952798 [Marasmius fiardii PR-910]
MWFSISLFLSFCSFAISRPLQSYIFPQPALVPGVFEDEFNDPIMSRITEHSVTTPIPSPLETVFRSATSELGHKIPALTSASATVLPFITHSVLGTLPPPSPPISHTTDLLSPASSPSTTTFTTTTSSNPSTSNNAPSLAPKGDGKEWKIVKMLLITIGTVVAITLLVAFVKKIYNFSRNVFDAGRSEGNEEVIPDWHRGWEIKLATEGGHRYPAADTTMATSHVYTEAIHNEVLGSPSLPPRLVMPSSSNPLTPYHSTLLGRAPSARQQDWHRTRTHRY